MCYSKLFTQQPIRKYWDISWYLLKYFEPLSIYYNIIVKCYTINILNQPINNDLMKLAMTHYVIILLLTILQLSN